MQFTSDKVHAACDNFVDMGKLKKEIPHPKKKTKEAMNVLNGS